MNNFEIVRIKYIPYEEAKQSISYLNDGDGIISAWVKRLSDGRKI